MFNLLSLTLGFLASSNFARRTTTIGMLEPYDLVRNVARQPIQQLSYNKFMDNIKNVDTAAIVENKNVAILHDKLDNLNLYKYLPQNTDDVVNTLIKNHVDFQVFDLSKQGIQVPFLVQIIGLIIVFNIISLLI